MNKLIPIQKMSFLFHLRIFLLDYTELIYLVGIVLTLVWGTWKANKVVDSLMFIFIFIIFELRFRIYVFEYYFIVTIFFLVLLSRSWNYEKKMYRYLSITYILFVLSGYFFNGLYKVWFIWQGFNYSGSSLHPNQIKLKAELQVIHDKLLILLHEIDPSYVTILFFFGGIILILSSIMFFFKKSHNAGFGLLITYNILMAVNIGHWAMGICILSTYSIHFIWKEYAYNKPQ